MKTATAQSIAQGVKDLKEACNGDTGDCLYQLSIVTIRFPHARLFDLMDRVADVLERETTTNPPPNPFRGTWEEKIFTPSVPQMLRTFDFGDPRAERRLKQIATWEKPFVSRWAVQQLDNPAAKRFRKQLLGFITSCPDARSLIALDDRGLEAEANKLRRLLDKQNELPAEFLPWIDRLESGIAGSAPEEKTEESLLALIYDNPEDDGARRVYADWLLGRSDARGEFINLQLSDTPQARARAKQLLAKHRKAWHGPLGDSVADAEFTRGFVSTCRISPIAPWVHATERAWRTVTHLEDYGQQNYTALLSPSFEFVRRYGYAEASGLCALSNAPRPLKLEHLAVREISSTGLGRSMPALRRLDFFDGRGSSARPPPQLAQLMATALGRQIVHLGAAALPDVFAAWLDAFRTFSGVARLTVGMRGIWLDERAEISPWRLEVGRDGGLTLDAHLLGRNPRAVPQLIETLAGLPARTFAALHLAVPRTGKGLDELRRVARICATRLVDVPTIPNT